MTETSIRIQVIPLETFDTTRQARDDVRMALARRCPVNIFTELGKDTHRADARNVAADMGFRLRGGEGDTAIAVANDCPILDFASHEAHGSGEDGLGPWGRRTLDTLMFGHGDERLTVIAAHFLRPGTPGRESRRRHMAHMAAELLADHSAGRKIAILGGDFNQADTAKLPAKGTPLAVLKTAGATSIFDELGVYPGTGPGGRAIDNLISMDRDRRLRFSEVRIHRGGNTDHVQLVGVGKIRAAA